MTNFGEVISSNKRWGPSFMFVYHPHSYHSWAHKSCVNWARKTRGLTLHAKKIGNVTLKPGEIWVSNDNLEKKSLRCLSSDSLSKHSGIRRGSQDPTGERWRFHGDWNSSRWHDKMIESLNMIGVTSWYIMLLIHYRHRYLVTMIIDSTTWSCYKTKNDKHGFLTFSPTGLTTSN